MSCDHHELVILDAGLYRYLFGHPDSARLDAACVNLDTHAEMHNNVLYSCTYIHIYMHTTTLAARYANAQMQRRFAGTRNRRRFRSKDLCHVATRNRLTYAQYASPLA